MSKRRRRRSASQILFYALSIMIVLSMAVGYILVALPGSEPTPTPVPQAPTATSQATTAPDVTASPSPEASVTPLPLPERPTPDPSVTRYSFAVIGDSAGNSDVYQALLDMAEADGNSFVVHLGNLVSQATAADFQEWRDRMAAFPLPVYTVPGNQDANDGSLAAYLAFSDVPGAHYSFDQGMVHFAMVDSHRGYLTAEESAWLDADLAATKQPVKIVALHYPPLDPRESGDIMTMGNEAFITLMKKHDVEYVFAGHIRAYDQVSRDGVIYIISGGGGAELSRSEAAGGFYHYVQVTVDGTDVQTSVRRLAP